MCVWMGEPEARKVEGAGEVENIPIQIKMISEKKK